MYNRVVLIGYLTRDPELKHSSNGIAICKIGVASNQKIGNKEETLFIDAISFGKNAENINNYFKKGKPILIEGRIALNTWTDKNGQKRSKHEIIIERFKFLERKTKDENYTSNNSFSNSATQQSQQTHIEESHNEETISDDEIPF